MPGRAASGPTRSVDQTRGARAPLSPTGATAASGPTTERAATPHIKAKLTKKTIKISGADGLRAGRVKLSVSGKGIVEFAMFKKGYDIADFTKDVNKFGAKNDIKALKHALANTEILGGLAGGGTGTIVFPLLQSATTIELISLFISSQLQPPPCVLDGRTSFNAPFSSASGSVDRTMMCGK